MADIALFLRQGWKILWKQKIIWIFSALPMIDLVLSRFETNPGSNLIWLIQYWVVTLLSIILSIVSIIGVPYIAYSSTIKKTVNIREVFSAVRKFAWREIGCSCLGFLIYSPLIILWYMNLENAASEPNRLSSLADLYLLPLALLYGMLDITLFEFFATDCDFRSGLKNAWGLFTNHFIILATLGLGLSFVFHLYSIFCAGLSVIFESGLDISVLSKINFLMPYSISLENSLFSLFNGVGQMIYTPYSASVFAVAYMKYKRERRF